MSKCTKCGKKGLFLKLNSAGICNACESLAIRQKLLAQTETKLADANKLIKEIQDKALNEIQGQIDN